MCDVVIGVRTAVVRCVARGTAVPYQQTWTRACCTAIIPASTPHTTIMCVRRQPVTAPPSLHQLTVAAFAVLVLFEQMSVRCSRSSSMIVRRLASSHSCPHARPTRAHSARCFSSTSPQAVAKHVQTLTPPPTRLTEPLSEQIATLRDLLNRRSRILALTGAGISTESGIPDYRSPGRPPHNPITHQAFMRSDAIRKRYWARSMVGYHRMQAAQPNSGHVSLAAAQRNGRIHHIVTQNVDALHEKAGASHVVHLHGNINQVQCQQCKRITSRAALQRQLEELNPAFAQHVHQLIRQATVLFEQQMAQQQQQRDGSANGQSTPLSAASLIPHNHDEDAPLQNKERSVASLRPDGDIELQNEAYYSEMNIPACDECGGILKPDVVFFGANVPREVHAQVDSLLASSDAVLVVGTSLTVWSAFRVIKAALARVHTTDASSIPLPTTASSPIVSSNLDLDSAAQSSCLVGIINDGPTRADALIAPELRIPGRAGIVLQQLFEQQ